MSWLEYYTNFVSSSDQSTALAHLNQSMAYYTAVSNNNNMIPQAKPTSPVHEYALKWSVVDLASGTEHSLYICPSTSCNLLSLLYLHSTSSCTVALIFLLLSYTALIILCFLGCQLCCGCVWRAWATEPAQQQQEGVIPHRSSKRRRQKVVQLVIEEPPPVQVEQEQEQEPSIKFVTPWCTPQNKAVQQGPKSPLVLPLPTRKPVASAQPEEPKSISKDIVVLSGLTGDVAIQSAKSLVSSAVPDSGLSPFNPPVQSPPFDLPLASTGRSLPSPNSSLNALPLNHSPHSGSLRRVLNIKRRTVQSQVPPMSSVVPQMLLEPYAHELGSGMGEPNKRKPNPMIIVGGGDGFPLDSSSQSTPMSPIAINSNSDQCII